MQLYLFDSSAKAGELWPLTFSKIYVMHQSLFPVYKSENNWTCLRNPYFSGKFFRVHTTYTEKDLILKYALHVNYYVRKETYSNLEYFRSVSSVYTNHVILVAKLICNTSKEESKTVFESFETSLSSNLLCHYKQESCCWLLNFWRL